MTTHDRHPLRAEARDRTGQRLEITAGASGGEAHIVVARPGHPPIVEIAADAEELADLADVVDALRQALAGQR
jgi:hypothetical protein